MNWSARGNVFNQYLRNTSIGTTVNIRRIYTKEFGRSRPIKWPPVLLCDTYPLLIFRLKILSSVSILNTLYLEEEDGCYPMPMASMPQKDDKK